jgi:hypothetical protein
MGSWSYVLVGYAITIVVLLGYAAALRRRERVARRPGEERTDGRRS